MNSPESERKKFEAWWDTPRTAEQIEDAKHCTYPLPKWAAWEAWEACAATRQQAEGTAPTGQRAVVEGEPKAGRSMCSDQDPQIAGVAPVAGSRSHQKGYCSESSDSAPSTTAAPTGQAEPAERLVRVLKTARKYVTGEYTAENVTADRALIEMIDELLATPAAGQVVPSTPLLQRLSKWIEHTKRYDQAVSAALTEAYDAIAGQVVPSEPPAGWKLVPAEPPAGPLANKQYVQCARHAGQWWGFTATVPTVPPVQVCPNCENEGLVDPTPTSGSGMQPPAGGDEALRVALDESDALSDHDDAAVRSAARRIYRAAFSALAEAGK